MMILLLSAALAQTPSPRLISINGVPLTAARLKVVERVERGGVRLPNGAW